MPSDQNPLDDAADPTEDNPGDEGEDKAQDDTDTGPVDWEAQYLEAQKAISRQGAELALLRRGESSDDDAEALGEDAPDDSSYVAILEQQSWDLARATYGDAAMDAYEAFYQSNRTAQTPSDHIAALEAYYDVRSGQAAALAAASADKTVEPSQARIDTNRSDPSPDLTETFAEARKSGKLEDFTKAASAALGFGSNKR